MKISSIYIDGFGIFHNESIPKLDTGLVLFQGNNESGKSTLLGFIRTILFGFPRANSRDPSYPPLSGGAPGGRIGLVVNNREYIVERKPGKSGGLVTVSGADKDTGQNELLLQLLCGITYEAFKNIYAFSLSELQTIETLKAESVKSVIYGAGTGTAMLALPKAEKQIKDRLDLLFKPGGSNPLINKQTAKLEHIRSELHKASKGIAEYDLACDELRQMDEQIKTFGNDLAVSRLNMNKFSSYEHLWPEWLCLQECKTGLAQSSVGQVVEIFPENGLVRMEKGLDYHLNHQTRFNQLKEDLVQLSKEAKNLTVDKKLVNEADAIAILSENRNDYIEKCRSLPLKEQEKKTLELEIKGLSGRLGGNWPEERLRKIDRSIFALDAIYLYEEKFNRLERDFDTAGKILSDKKDQYEKSDKEESAAAEIIKQSGGAGIIIDKRLITGLQQGRDEFAGAAGDIIRRKDELKEEKIQLDRLIREIDPAWNVSRIENFDNSIIAQKKVSDFDLSLKQAETDLRDSEILHTANESSFKNAKKKYEIAASKLQNFPEHPNSYKDELGHRKSSVNNLRNDLLNHNQLDLEKTHQQERLSDKTEELGGSKNFSVNISPGLLKRLTIISIVLCISVPGALALLGKPVAAGVTGCIFFIAAIVFTASCRLVNKALARSGHIKNQIAVIQTALDAICGQVLELDKKIACSAKEINLPEPVLLDHLNTLYNRIEEDILAFELQCRLAEEAQRLYADVEQLSTKTGNAEKNITRFRESLQIIKNRWKEFLKKNNLNTDLTPALATVIFSKVETCRKQLNNINILKNRICKMEQTINNYFALAQKAPYLAESCKGSSHGLLSAVDKLFPRLQQEEKQREKHRLAQQTYKEKCKTTADRREAFKNAEETLYQLDKTKSKALSEWKTWLIERGMPDNLSPKTALEAFDKIGKCLEKIDAKDRIEAEISKLEKSIDSYQKRVHEIMGRLGQTHTDAEKTAVVVSGLVSELDISKGNLREKNRIKSQTKITKSQLKSARKQVIDCNRQIKKLLQESGTDNKDEFFKKEHLFSERKKLLNEIKRTEQNIRRISGESDTALIKKTLKTLTIDKIRISSEKLAHESENIERDIEELRNKKAELKQKIEAMKSADDITMLRNDEETGLAQIQQSSLEWASFAVAGYLINKAKKKFEKEQQPGTILNAGIFFREITESRYEGLVCPIGKNTVEAVTSLKKRKQPEELSRGTAEQLYLALRFGYIKNRAGNSGSLPVIMDDILVNFDPGRAKNTAKTILELSKDLQILFFTCHPETIDIFKDIDSRIPLYNIKDGRITKELKNT